MKGPGFVEQGCWDQDGLSEGRAVDAASPGRRHPEAMRGLLP